MTSRYDIRDLDRTCADGTVHATVQNDRIEGRAAAYEGDPVSCPKCNTVGRIVCVGGRQKERGPDGRRQALSGDLCYCHCRPYPVLIASQQRSRSRT